jgi:ribosomal protein L23
MDQLFSELKNNANNITNATNATDTPDTNKINKDAENLLKKQQISTEKLNSLLEQSLNTLACGPDCQKEKIKEELKKRYQDAETNLQTAPVQLETTKKNYYVFTEGRPYYNDMLEKELKKKAALMGKLLTDNFHEEIINAKTMNSYYNTQLNNSDYTKELYAVYLEKNKVIQDGIKNHHADVLTNDRKTYYETEALEELKNWYTFFWYFYYFFVMPIFGFTLFFKTTLHFLVRVIIECIVLTYPYYIGYIVSFIYGFFHSLWKQLPKNVYNDL